MSNQDEIKVSVCVVTYNQEEYIGECLQSLVDQEAGFLFEIIVGEDCSTDKTREIVEDFALRYPDLIVRNYHEENIGPTKNLFSTYALAKGEYIAHMDGDDLAFPEKLARQCQYLDDYPECQIVWSRMKILNNSTSDLHDDLLESERILNKNYTQADLVLLGSVACHSSKMFRSSTLVDFKRPNSEVYDFFLSIEQLKNNGYGKIHPDFLGVYRSGVGVLRNTNIDSLYVNNIEYLLSRFPHHKAFFSAKFAILFLMKLKRRKIDMRLACLFLKNIRPGTFRNVFIFLENSRYLRSPV